MALKEVKVDIDQKTVERPLTNMLPKVSINTIALNEKLKFDLSVISDIKKGVNG